MKTTAITITAAILSLALHAGAKPVPAELPDPDGQPSDATKPIKVFILSGQSNMVGAGKATGRSSRWGS